MRVTEEKIKDRSEIVKICRSLRKKKKLIGYTSGVFDILHIGHIDYLEKAKELCDVLVVGVNSDRSVKKYKGPFRPIIPGKQRARIVASLSFVDYVFLFDERRNKKNIELLRPHYYIKAGDYSEKELTSRKIVERYGGKTVIIPQVAKISTTEIINKILRTYLSLPEFDITPESGEKVPVVFLDRDGTIIKDVEYLHTPEKVELLPHAGEGLRKLQSLGYKLIIITNQPGIGLGYYSEEDFFRVNREMFSQLGRYNVTINKIYYCPHTKDNKCRCRKPNTALIEIAKRTMNIDLSRSYFIGDSTLDVKTGENANLKTILLLTGKQGKDGNYKVKPTYVAKDLLDAANYISRQVGAPQAGLT
jgi:rfaE bifunctional protein nucleotidyltransferase chain/domain